MTEKAGAAIKKGEETEAGDGQGDEDGSAQPGADNAALIAENEQLKAQLSARQNDSAPTTRPKVTAAILAGLTDEEWEQAEKQSNMPRAVIIENVRRRELDETRASVFVRDAIDDEMEKDPQVAKLRGPMREYLETIAVEDKADPERLKRHIQIAKRYARGLLSERGAAPAPKVAGQGQGKAPPPPSPRGQEGDDEANATDFDSDTKAVRPGAEVRRGDLRLKVADLISPEKRKRMKHATDPNGVSFRNYDKPPKFARHEEND